MNLSRSKKGPNYEAQEFIRNNAKLQGWISETVQKTESSNKGFMYLSRFNTDEEDIVQEKEKEKRPKTSEVEGASVVETKTQESATTSTVNVDKKRRYALSLATLAAKPSKRLTIVHEGAIPTLIELSSVHDKAIQIRCSSAYAALSSEPQLRSRMLDEKALTAIISLVTASNLREVKLECCRSICNLSCEPEYEGKMVKEQVPYAVQHIAQACPESYDNCLKILLNLSCVNDKYTRIEDVTECLMWFLNMQLTHSQDVLLLSSFCNLSALKGNQLRLVEDGCLRVIEKFYKSQHGSIRIMACEILKNLTTDSRTRTKLLDLNIVATLLKMSRDPEEEIKMQCLRSFFYLSKDAHFRQQIVYGDAFDLILRTSEKYDNREMGQITAKTLRILCGDKDIAPTLVNNGVVTALIKLLGSDDEVIHQYIAESFCALMQYKEILHTVVEQGADKVMVTLSYQTTSKLTCEWCSFALFFLAKAQVFSAHVSKDDILPCVINLCNQGTELSKVFCCASFAQMTQAKTVDCSGAIPMLVKMLKTESDQGIKKFCASALFNLADVDENCFAMLEEGALLPVVELTQSDYMQTKVICAGIISRLSLQTNYYDQFAVGNILKILLQLSQVDHRLTQRRVVIALSNLSQNEALRLKLLEHDPIPYIIALASERDELLRRGCIAIVCNMSFVAGSEKAIVQAGIVPRLLITSLITSDQIASKIPCVKALTNLMADPAMYDSMIKNGVIWGLSKLAQLQNSELLLLCAKALARFSCKYAGEMLSSNVCVKTILQLLDNPDMAMKKTGARILTNVLLQTTEKDEDFRRHVVENMTPLVKCKDDELNEMSVLCLCLTSQSESCRAAIVSSGMLQMLESSTIFSDRKVSYAYISMFSNIANNPNTRSKVLDDALIERFEQICSTKDQFLDLAVAKALYFVSCSAENIPRLVDQKILPFIQTMAETDYTTDKSPEFTILLVATLYNLTTCPEVQARLVSEGFVDVIQSFWPDAERDFKICKLAYLSICHLACGRTNSARMVEDGCTSILCFITEYRTIPAYKDYKFSGDIYLRCSAALRNLISVVSNQKAMVNAGCLDTLIILANNSARLMTANANSTSAMNPQMRGVRINCAAALKSMTYNKEIRDILVQSDAINVILSDLRKDCDDLNLTQGLLKEIEAESWDNGARGKTKDGRAKPIKPSELSTDLVKGTSNVQLNVSIKEEALEKYCVHVQLDEQNNAAEEQEVAASSNTTTPRPDDEGRERGEEISIKDLKGFEDTEDISSLLQAMNYAKEEAVQYESDGSLLRMDNFDTEEDPGAGGSVDTGSVNSARLTDAPNSVNGDEPSAPASPKSKKAAFLPGLLQRQGSTSSVNKDFSKSASTLNLDDFDPPSNRGGKLPHINKGGGAKGDTLRKSSAGRNTLAKSASSSSADAGFDALLHMIKDAEKQSRLAKGSDREKPSDTMSEALHQWKKISRF